jgi:hypothetical protein
MLTTKHLIKATVLSAAWELIARLLFSHHGFALEDPPNESQDLTEDGKEYTRFPTTPSHVKPADYRNPVEKPTEIDDGCTAIGRLEASANRRWTWTVRNALSWKRHDAERQAQGQQEEEDSAKQKA